MLRIHTAVFLAVLLAPAIAFAQAEADGRGCGGEGGSASCEVSCITLMGDDGARVTIEDLGDRMVLSVDGEYAKLGEDVRTLVRDQLAARVAEEFLKQALAALEGGEKRVEMPAKAEAKEEGCGGDGGGCGGGDEGCGGRGRSSCRGRAKSR
jgi:hypothetical protein